MPEIKNNFLQGKMNKDLDDRLLPNGQYRDASNIQVSKSENSDVGTAQNIKGNDYEYGVDNAITGLPSGSETIGFYKNDLTKEIFWFVTDFTGSSSDESNSMTYATNSNTCKIYYKQIGTSGAPQPIIDSYRLNFSKKHPILHANLLNNLLFWTDNYNQPRRINVDLAKAGGTYTNDNYLEDKISVAQYSPPTAPKVTMTVEGSSAVGSLHIRNKFVKFAYRFQYTNKEYSLISPFTQTCFHPGKGKLFNTGSFANDTAGMLSSADQGNAVKQTTVESMQNLANRVALFIDLPSNINKENHASCDANGNMAGDSHSIDNVNGTISDDDILVTARGDNQIVDGGNKTTTLSTNSDVSPTIIDNTRLYFFTNIANYDAQLQIEKIQILYSESDSVALKVVDTIKYADIQDNITYRVEPISGNTAKLIYGYKYIYDSTKPIQTLPEADLIRVADVIPVKAKTQEVSGNRLIYGNFLQNRTLDNAVTKDRFEIKSGDQLKFNDQYLLSSVKSNREYSVGLVLSDRYGRQSTVFLPTNNTTFVNPTSTTPITNGTSSWKHSVLKVDFNNIIQDAYDADTNPLGWYSYKVVVKQSEQEYYNVYAPTLVDNIPSTSTRSWLVLHGDNVNKVPRDVTDANTENGTQGSQTQLLPKILDLNGTQTQQTSNSFINVISIGTKEEQGFSSINDFYLDEKGPLLAELPDTYGRNHVPSTTFDNLVVLETEPFKSALDIYYETSTAGLVSHLNAAITDALGSIPSNISLSVSSIVESLSSGSPAATISSTDTSNSPVSSPAYTILSITDANGTNRSGAFTISGNSLLTGENFEFTNSNTDSYIIRIQVTDGSGNVLAQNKSFSITNAAPTITVGSTLSIPASTSSGTVVRTITAINGSAKTSVQSNNLTFSITGGNAPPNFVINSTTGELSTFGPVTSGDTYNLTIQVSDVGGLTNSATLAITITSASYNSFYISEGDVICGTNGANVCDDSIGTQRWHSGSGSVPSQGDIVYSTSSGTIFNGGGYCYAFAAVPDNGTGTPFFANISSSGVVGAVSLCS